jgi:ABC-type enterochelin transport system substrate-binding protein
MFTRLSIAVLLACILTVCLTEAASTKRTQNKSASKTKSKVTGTTTSRPALTTLKQVLAEARTPQEPASVAATTTTTMATATVDATTQVPETMQPFFDCHQDNVGYEIVTG